MSSSESEDDCYGNIAQRLQKMKNNFEVPAEVKIVEEKTVLDDDSYKEIDEIIASNKNIINAKAKEIQNCKKSSDIGLESTPISRRTRNAKRKNAVDIDVNAALELDLTKSVAVEKVSIVSNRGKRGRGRGKRGRASDATAVPVNTSASSSEIDLTGSIAVEEMPNIAARGQGSGQRSGASGSRGSPANRRGSPANRRRNTNRRGRGRGRIFPQMCSFYNNLPIYSVGNTDEYPDHSDNQVLFSSKTATPDVMVVEEEIDENEELSVKVYWQSTEIYKFPIRKYQKIVKIFDYFSKEAGVNQDKLFFRYNNLTLKPEDTPDSIDYNISKFIDGGVVKQSVSQIVNIEKDEDKNGIKVKFQCQSLKKPFKLTISKEDKLLLAMVKCAEHLELPLEKLKFEFDGDLITGKSTAAELELEGGECFDIKILS